MRTREELWNFYNETVPTLQKDINELVARSAKKRWLILLWGGGIGSLASIIAGFAMSDESVTLILLIVAMVIVVTLIICDYCGMIRNRNAMFKNRLVSNVVKFIEQNLEYSPRNYVPMPVYHKSGIYQQHVDRHSGEDLISGSYKGVEMMFSELHTEYKTTTHTKNGSHTTWHTIFKGVFMCADFHKHFKHKMLVVPDIAESIFGQMFGNWLQKMNMTRNGSLVRMEDLIFEKYFAVYADDQIEARYILTPKMMERMVELRKFFKTHIAFSFCDSNIFIAIPTNKDFFECKGTVIDYQTVETLYHEIICFISLIDELELNLRIWTKE